MHSVGNRSSSPTPPWRLAFYGDDFTGSADAMEALARAGLRTVLFLDPPSAAQLKRYAGLRAFGVAGTSRTMSPREMDRHLPAVFEVLRRAGPAIVHYKICSTLDSSPRVGSVGRAIDLAQAIFRSPWVPLLVGAPFLGRYCVFGNLFARSGLDSEPIRLDRHPTMAHHPVTPMTEADVGRHLACQTRRSIGLLDVLKLESLDPAGVLRALREAGREIILLDVVREDHLLALGRLLWEERALARPQFTVGSSCVEYALVSWWRACGQLPASPSVPSLSQAKSLVAVSGSCSPVTDRQIGRAVAAGFLEVALDTEALMSARSRKAALERAMRQAGVALARGRSVIFHTARGPGDRRLGPTRRMSPQRTRSTAVLLGSALGELLGMVFDQIGKCRAVVTGGDTSGFAARALGIEALEYAAPLTPGSPLCRVHAPGCAADRTEIAFKGGQNGRDDFFLSALNGSDGPADTPARGRPRRRGGCGLEWIA